ncbi:ABC transporter ATP-binding protein [Tabrizicola sp. TH137]|uniref:ABC transporter ATP-binding protein n=1 Tax=Tabrizicola sp. TH137 TaxID=2067452 RepID=UPI000C79EC63|nr:ABC transporter ATP-binding protein [Tabrizicola sp. TH137]PLL10804.1 ABC transporter ATP-binding protein [Tabrizicola sp. TH137]
MIDFDGVTKSYRLRGGARRIVLQDFTMSLPYRNIAVLGRNGAGKSTLLRLISGLIDPDHGQITRSASMSWPIGLRASFHGMLTGIENIRFVARVYGADEQAVIDYVTEFAELGPFLYEPVRTYSAGMGARIGFGLSMALRFDVYLVDELLSVGDASFRAKSRRAFDDLLTRSRIILVSHSMGSLRDYCDCGLLVANGTARFYDDIEEAIDAYAAINA